MLACLAALALGTGPAQALGTDSTPPPAPGATPSPPDAGPAPPGPRETTCPAGTTPTLVTAPPASPRPGQPPPSTAVPGPPPTTLPDGRTVSSACALAPPTPLAGPQIAPEHTVGGPLLAGPGLVVNPPPGVPPPPEMADASYVLADMTTGQVLAAKAPHALLLPASTLKALTALVLLPALDPARVVTATTQQVTAEGTRVGLVPGNPYTVDQLFSGLVLVSGNDTAYALADAFGGREATLGAMNARAAALGAWDTVATDPSGLDQPGQRSSAYDLALIGRAVMQLPSYRRYAAQREVSFPGGTDPGGKVHPPFTIQNHNKLLYNYDGTIGVKNGYTTGARHTFVGAVTRGERTLLFAEMGSINPSWRPSAAMFDWGFAYGPQVAPVGVLAEPGTAARPPEWLGGSAIVTPSTAAAPSPPATPGERTTTPAAPPVATPAAPPVAIGPDGAPGGARGGPGDGAAGATGGTAPGGSVGPAWAWVGGAGVLFLLLAGAAVQSGRRAEHPRG